MRTTSAARTTTESIPRNASSLGPAVHPGEILLEEFLKPLETSPPLRAVHALVRRSIPAYERDRPPAPDIEAAAELLRAGAVLDAAASVCGRLE